MTYTPLSYQVEVMDGTTKTVPLHLSYALQSHISVTVEGAPDTTFTFSGSNIILTSMPSNGDTVVITRTEDKENLRTTYHNGAVLVESDLNAGLSQVYWIAQESFDKVEGFQTQIDAINVGSGNLPSVTVSNASDILAVNGSGVWSTSSRLTTAEATLAANTSAITANATTASTDLATHIATLGTSATKNAGNSAGEVLLLSTNNKLPSIDGSALTNRHAVVQYSERQNSGTHGGDATASTWKTRTITNLDFSHGTHGVTISGNRITLAGSKAYRISGRAMGYNQNGHSCRLRNTTTNVTAGIGSSQHHNGNAVNTSSEFVTVIPNGSGHQFELQTWTTSTQAVNGLGLATNSGEKEVYATLEIEVLS